MFVFVINEDTAEMDLSKNRAGNMRNLMYLQHHPGPHLRTKAEWCGIFEQTKNKQTKTSQHFSRLITESLD